MTLSTEEKMRYRIAQYSVDGAMRRSDKLFALAPEIWRKVDNRKAYTEKRMHLEGLLK